MDLEDISEMPLMFCHQCEQRTEGGCVETSDCGKSTQTSALQDMLMYMLKGVSVYMLLLRKEKVEYTKKYDHRVLELIFSTLTNVNFDYTRFIEYIKEVQGVREALKELLEKNNKPITFANDSEKICCNFDAMEKIEDIIMVDCLIDFEDVFDGGIPHGFGMWKQLSSNKDIHSLKSTLLYGLKGLAAYAAHANTFQKEDDGIYAFIAEAMVSTLGENPSVEYWVGMLMKCGEWNFKALELLDAGNNTLGVPAPKKVMIGGRKGPCILVSGHDLLDLKWLLEQTEGKGVNVYTHGEMLPAHGYPQLNKYKHLVGHFGDAWYRQQSEFKKFPGPIFMTTNCILEPREQYKHLIYTTSVVGWEGCKHIPEKEGGGKDFTEMIEHAQKMGGFAEDFKEFEEVTTGFGHAAVLGVAGKVVELIKAKKIKHIFLIGGCDGASKRRYFTDFSKSVPEDCLILTLGCGKYRVIKEKRPDIEGIPTILDMGQCNDSFGAVKVAVALAEVFKCGVNDLPLSMVISWFEQKAVAVLLTLLFLKIKNIRLGPTLPEFISPTVLQFLVDTFNIMPTTTPEKDMKDILGN